MFKYIERVAKDTAKYNRAMAVLGILYTAAVVLGIIIVIRA